MLPELTPEQLEKAARFLCAKRGLDPDKRVYQNDDSGWLTDQWRLTADEITAQYQVLQAIYTVTQDEPEPNIEEDVDEDEEHDRPGQEPE